MRRQDESESSGVMRLLAWIYRMILVALMAAGLRMHGDLLLSISEYGVALAACWVLLTVLHKIYQACNAGHIRVSELVLSQTLSNLISVGGIYLCLSLYEHRLLRVTPLLAVFLLQEAVGVVWSMMANKVYYAHYVPPRTAIIYSADEALERLYETPYFQMKYDVCKLIKEPADDIQELIPELGDCKAIFAVDVSAKLANGIAKFCAEKDIKGFFVPRLGHIVISGAEYISMFSMPVLKVQRAGGKAGYRTFKCMFDIAASLVGVLITSPIMLITALAIYMEDHGPVFYRQTRLTRNGREFSILKFRSMTVNAEKDGVARLAGANDSRIKKSVVLSALAALMSFLSSSISCLAI